MNATDPQTGAEVPLRPTTALTEELSNYHKSAVCSHERKEVRNWIFKGGSDHFYFQCLLCGEKVGQGIPRGTVKADVASEDPSIAKIYQANHRKSLDDIYQRHLKIQQTNDTRFSEKYRAHLESPAWIAKRTKVMQRARKICEGCLEERAEHVHHMTYDNLGNEFLFELVAVCMTCHARLHEGRHIAIDEGVPASCDGCCHLGLKGDVYHCHNFGCATESALIDESMCGVARSGFEPNE
jgi:hypothetical protein